MKYKECVVWKMQFNKVQVCLLINNNILVATRNYYGYIGLYFI